MVMEHWLNDHRCGTNEGSERNLKWRHFIHHKSCVDYLWIVPKDFTERNYWVTA